MANLAAVIPKTMPSDDEIHSFIEGIVRKKFPQFMLVRHEKPTYTIWTLRHKLEQHIALQFWTGKTFNPDEEYQEAEDYTEMPCIEFQHGHNWNFLWWVERELREPLAVHFDARIIDDGVGETKPKTNSYDTYEEYVKATMPEWSLSVWIDEEIQHVPDDIKTLIKAE